MTLGIIAAGIAVFTGIGAGKINSALLLGCALAEGTAIFGFITALLVIFMG